MAQFADGEQCKLLLIECPALVQLVVSGYRNARIQPNHRSTLFDSRLEDHRFLKILRDLSFADDSVSDRLVCDEVLTEISAAVQMDPNRCVQGVYLYWDVFFGADTLFHMLLADGGRHVPRVRRERDILAGFRIYFPSQYILNSAIHI